MVRSSRLRAKREAHPDFDWSPQHHPRMLITSSNQLGYPTFLDVRV